MKIFEKSHFISEVESLFQFSSFCIDDLVFKLSQYESALTEWSTTMNLISTSDFSKIWSRHFFDALYGYQFIFKHYGESVLKSCSWIDIGSGAGFPILPCQILFPTAFFYMIEVRKKKYIFLNYILALLGLSKGICSSIRSESIAVRSSFKDSFHIATCRSVGTPAFCIPNLLAFLITGGVAVIWCGGDSWFDDVCIDHVSKQVKGCVILKQNYTLPLDEKQNTRRIIMIQKM